MYHIMMYANKPFCCLCNRKGMQICGLRRATAERGMVYIISPSDEHNHALPYSCLMEPRAIFPYQVKHRPLPFSPSRSSIQWLTEYTLINISNIVACLCIYIERLSHSLIRETYSGNKHPTNLQKKRYYYKLLQTAILEAKV
jgi:hypothetical protein